MMRFRWVLHDKNAPKRTIANPLPLEASARLVLPGFKDRALMEGTFDVMPQLALTLPNIFCSRLLFQTSLGTSIRRMRERPS